MQKVSRTMLAVVAAIQSGAHTRRKPKYIKEQALVSYLYDQAGISFAEPPKVIIKDVAIDTVVIDKGHYTDSMLTSGVNFVDLLLEEPVVKAGEYISEVTSILPITFTGLTLDNVIHDVGGFTDETVVSVNTVQFTDVLLDMVVLNIGEYEEGVVCQPNVHFENILLETV